MAGGQWTALRIARELFEIGSLRDVLRGYMVRDPEGAQALSAAVAGVFRFRQRFVEKMPIEKRCEFAANAVRSPAHEMLTREAVTDALVDYHFNEKRELVCAFLDECGIDHEDGQVGTAPPLEPATVLAATEGFRDRFGSRAIAVYLATAGLVTPRWREAMWPVADLLASDIGESAIEEPPIPDDAAEPESLGAEAALTALDDLVIKAAVASISGTEGAFSSDRMADAVEELVALSADRHQSYFHRGFFGQLAGEAPGTEFVERNDSRVAWLTAGRVMAMARQHCHADIVELHSRDRTAFDAMWSAATPSAVMVFPQLFTSYWSIERRAEAISVLGPELIAHCRIDFVFELVRLGEQLLLAHATAEARPIFDVLGHGLERRPGHPDLEARVARRRAQCMRAEGRFEASLEEFDRLIEGCAAGTGRRAELLSDKGLAQGGFRWLSDIGIPSNEEDAGGMIARLATGESAYAEAAAIDHSNRTNGAYALGVLALLRDKPEVAAGFLESAYSTAPERAERYLAAGVLPKIQLYYAIAILLAGDDARFGHAADLLRPGAETDAGRYPVWLLERAIEYAMLAPMEVRPGLIDALLALAPALLDTVIQQSIDDPASAPSMVPTVVEQRLSGTRRRPAADFHDLEWLLGYWLTAEDHERAGEILDRMEAMAHEHVDIRPEFQRVLEAPENYEPAWSEEESAQARAQLYERDGDYSQAEELLVRLAHGYASEGRLTDALGVMERVTQYGLGDTPALVSLRKRLDAVVPAQGNADSGGSPEAEGLVGRELRILFVGGNEVQAKYDDAVRRHFVDGYPRVQVEFIHTGWESRWGAHLETVERRLPAIDGVVVMHLIRTELGRAVRAAAGRAGVEWGACTGHGRDSMIRAIESLARRVG